MMKRGAFIVLEGCDRSGKTTQSKLLVEKLKNAGVSVEHMGFPVRSGSMGQMINAYLTNLNDLPDQSIHLLFTANRWEFKSEMEKKLKSGTTLIVDRYYPSGIAYSVAKGMNFEWCKAPEVGLIEPDAVLYLKGTVSNLAERGNYGEERYDKIEFQGKVADVYNRMCEEHSFWYIFDASLPKQAVTQNLTEKVMQILHEAADTPLKTLQ